MFYSNFILQEINRIYFNKLVQYLHYYNILYVKNFTKRVLYFHFIHYEYYIILFFNRLLKELIIKLRESL